MLSRIKPDRLERLLSPDVHLRDGNGGGIDDGTFDACVMQAVDWVTGGDGTTDAPSCVDPVIRQFCIRLNDAPRYAQWRDELKPFAPRIANTNFGETAARKRAYMCADWAIRTVAPMWLEFWAEHSPKRANEAKSWAQRLRAVPPIIDKDSALAGRAIAEAAASAAKAAGDADYAAYAAGYAVDYAAKAADYAAAKTADYAAYAAGYAVDYAAKAAGYADAAYAADYAAYAAKAAGYADAAYAVGADAALLRRLWDESLRFLGEMIAYNPDE